MPEFTLCTFRAEGQQAAATIRPPRHHSTIVNRSSASKPHSVQATRDSSRASSLLSTRRTLTPETL